MKITSIKPQVKRVGWYSIFIDGKYGFSLSETALLNTKLVPGQDIDKASLKELRETSSDDKAYNQSLRYVAMRPRSVWEVKSYLSRKKLPDETIDPIIKKLRKVKLLDDQAFARSWVDNRRLLKPSSTRKIKLELRQKGVDETIVVDVLGDQKQHNAVSLKSLIERKRRQTKYLDNQKLMEYLARQGFNYDDIKVAISEIE